ncbi:MAG TPA: disulfide bond formation protein B [Gammaproteobacteria bacterium]|nr:disulfide bond formation protein B [Gammaproteobacteria bacterium]
MKRFIIELSGQRRYWIALMLTGIALEAAALYYQYARNELPCLLCIQVRMLVMAFVLLALLAFFFTRSRWAMRIFHGLSSLFMLALLERSWQVLAVERGWTFGECEMDLGMPAWFALDKWIPSVFEVQTACGYTPLIVFQITLAEALLVFSAILVIISAALFVASWCNNN